MNKKDIFNHNVKKIKIAWALNVIAVTIFAAAIH